MSAPKSEPPLFVAAPDRASELPVDGLEVLISAVERIGAARVRHAARNAFAHIRKAWILHPIDSEMSWFRTLTGEEEAATALILALKQQRYPGAERLNPKDHAHKAAIWPMIEAIARGFVEKGVPAPVISVSKEGRPRISADVDIGTLIGMDRPFWVHPVDPFHVVIHSDRKGPFEVHRFEEELAQIAGGERDIESYIRGRANERNRILYASDGGIPAVRFEDAAILNRLQRVKWLLVATIGILQTKTLQLLVIQALEALLLALRRVETAEYEFPPHGPPAGDHLTIEQQPDGSYRSEFRQKRG